MKNQEAQKLRGNLKIQALAVLVGVILLIVKFTAWVITGSNSILSDALESIINVLAGLLALFSIYYSSQPRDADHPYGHGKIEFVSSGFEGVLVITAGLIIISKAVYNLIYPQELQALDIGILLSVIAGFANFILAAILIRRGRSTKSIAMEADGKHLLSDGYSTVGMLVGLVIVWYTGLIWIDNVVAILFGALVLKIGFSVAKDALAGILDETDLNLVDKFIAILEPNRKPDWIDIHKFRIIKFGNVLHVDCHITVPWYYTVDRSHQIVDEVENLVNKELDQQVELFIHTDPCRPSACNYCALQNCAERKHPFQKRLTWTKANVLSTDRHETLKFVD